MHVYLYVKEWSSTWWNHIGNALCMAHQYTITGRIDHSSLIFQKLVQTFKVQGACNSLMYIPLLMTSFVTRVTRRMTLVKQVPLTAPKLPHLLVGFVLLDLQFSVWCFVDRCLTFFSWPLYCLFFFDLRILIARLISSNSSFDDITSYGLTFCYKELFCFGFFYIL